MAIQGMNHFNVLTDKLAATRAFYIGHVSEGKVPADPAGVLDHLAFSATDLKGTVAKLKANGIEFTLRRQVRVGTWQIFCHDPCGAKVELDFSPEEPAPADS
jgi:catechol 2,3-dioxygenase-like lactoylglutathione lyase family enzyme